MVRRIGRWLLLFAALSVIPAIDALAQSAGAQFRDCERCPLMVAIPGGSYRTGDLDGNGLDSERPAHSVNIPRAFAVGVHEITYEQWDICVAEGGCAHEPGDDNWGRGKRAVRYVSWDDANAFIAWLSKKPGHPYRLLTEAEWEYVARAGTTTAYPWGDEFVEGKAVCLSCKVGSVMTMTVGQLPANDFGLFDTVASQKEWVQDCWNRNFEGAPTDGSAWTEGDCRRRVVRGGSWYDVAKFIRSASRKSAVTTDRVDVIGFRVARDLAE